jgi:hypothetical protein
LSLPHPATAKAANERTAMTASIRAANPTFFIKKFLSKMSAKALKHFFGT